MKKEIEKTINQYWDEVFCHIGTALYNHPEISEEEYKSSKLITDFFKKKNFSVEEKFCNIETAFKATYKSNRKGPQIALICEYDALPSMGHGCGHNLISTMSILAALGLQSVIDTIGGEIHVFGTPAEETNGAKVEMAKRGVFKNLSIAMMTHPSNKTVSSGSSLALCPMQFKFFGKTTHAAKEPEKGINALEAVIGTYNNINALRQYVTSDVRIHGIIDDGGKAANIVPDYASCQFYVRANKKKYLEEVSQKVINCAKASALSVGAEMEMVPFELSYDDMMTNQALSHCFDTNLISAGEPFIIPDQESAGSIDMGNVSYEVPSIHPWLGIGCENIALHTKEFADYTQTNQAKEAVKRGAIAMAWTGYDVLTDPTLLENIWQEFRKNR
ncbi:M20 family metallopeptidase [Crassaminicella profunda]|uniref:M20 family metallopeptidase n=1 Tax=Crassaminicella profunda TaxID=1286698 RepID=UPI001CA6EC07|nr:M20 family metallopeptidase [Crassaminicella profunda]QZY54503.1 M20 family metallopeptidase [Crassaminicella profunda]